MEEGRSLKVRAILATDLKGGIGKSGDLPWPKNQKDMKWFSESTNNSIVIMGSKTWESLKGKLPNRLNVVVTSKILNGTDGNFKGPIELIIKQFKRLHPKRNIWIIGGANIYNQSWDLVDEVYLTKFKQKYDCDTYIDLDLVENRKFELKRIDKRSDDIAEYKVLKRKKNEAV